MNQALDDIAPAFYAAKNRWPDAPNLQAHYDDLARTFAENGSSLLELCKSFLEMVCITVVNELGGTLPASSTPTTTELLGSALDVLGLRNERGASALGKVISGHNRLADGLSEVRNQEGSVAHGRDGFLDTLSDRHARVYLLSADTIIALILKAYEGVEPSILHTRETHNRYQHHNDRIDAGTTINAEVDEDGVLVLNLRSGNQREDEGIELRAPTSELLYYLDRQAYVSVLDALRGVSPVAEEEDEEVVLEVEDPAELPDATVPAPRQTETSQRLQTFTEYHGKYADRVHSLYDFIIHTLLGGNDTQAAQVQNLTYTLLNGMEDLGKVDWSKRTSTRTAVRLFVRKLFTLFAIDGLDREAVERTVEWLAQQIAGDIS